jgi:D-alanine-D-alanine ligase
MFDGKGRAPVILLYNYYKAWSAEEAADARRHAGFMVESLEALGHHVRIVEFWKDARSAMKGFDPARWIVFNWCEGVEEEVGGDARICSELEEMGFTYTGNPPAALRLSVEKGRAKKMLQRWDIPTPPGREFRAASDVAAWAHFPAIVKPVSQHCSAGVTRDSVVHDLEALRARVAYINATFKEAALAEAFVAGREINVGIWGNGRPRVLPLREIDFSRIENPLHRMVTWDSKWTPNSVDWNAMPVISEVKVSDTLRARIEDIVLRTYRAFDCRDYARVDLRIDRNEQPHVVDVNPNPDITADGGFIGACRAAGYTYGQAISNIIQMAVARRNRRAALFNTMQQRRLALEVEYQATIAAGG